MEQAESNRETEEILAGLLGWDQQVEELERIETLMTNTEGLTVADLASAIADLCGVLRQTLASNPRSTLVETAAELLAK